MMTKSKKITNLVFQGGSVKGVAYLGALRALTEHVGMQQMKRVASTTTAQGAKSISSHMLGISHKTLWPYLLTVTNNKT